MSSLMDFLLQERCQIFFTLFSLCHFLSLTRAQSPSSSPSHGSRTAAGNSSSSAARSTSASAPAPAPSPSAAPALQLHHVHHQLLHVRRRLPEPAVDDEDGGSLLRPDAAQLRTPDTAVPRLPTACGAASGPPSFQLPAPQLGAGVSAAGLQQLPSASHAAGPRTPSSHRSARWVSSAPRAPGTVAGTPAPSARHAYESRRVDEVRVKQQSVNGTRCSTVEPTRNWC